jgi:hypothetical protein
MSELTVTRGPVRVSIGDVDTGTDSSVDVRLYGDAVFFLNSKGETLAKIAASLGVAEDRLYRALLAADVGYSEREQHDRQTRTYFEDTRMYNMRRQGSSHAEIAAAMGWDAGPAGRRRVANRIIKYCERIGISIPVADVIQRVDGTRRRVGYSKEIMESMERRIQRARTRRPKGKRG